MNEKKYYCNRVLCVYSGTVNDHPCINCIDYFENENKKELLQSWYSEIEKTLEEQLSEKEKEIKELKIRLSEVDCNCTLSQKLVGDGCEKCNPVLSLDYAKQTIEDQNKELNKYKQAIKEAVVKLKDVTIVSIFNNNKIPVGIEKIIHKLEKLIEGE